MSEKRKCKKTRDALEDKEIKATKLELKRIEKLIIRKKKEILKEKSRILKEKAMKLCSYHLKMRGIQVNNSSCAQNEIDDAIRTETEAQPESMDDFYTWAFNDSKKKMQKMAGKILSLAHPPAPSAPAAPAQQDLRGTQRTTARSPEGQSARTMRTTTHFVALSDFSKGDRTMDQTMDGIEKYSKKRKMETECSSDTESCAPVHHPPPGVDEGHDSDDSDGSDGSDDRRVGPRTPPEPRDSCRKDVLAIREYISKGMWQKFVDLYMEVTAHYRFLNTAEITDITKALVRKSAVSNGFANFTKLLLASKDLAKIDKQNISNIGVNILLCKESDTSSEDALSVTRTMLHSGIRFHELSRSATLSESRIVELAAKYLLDSKAAEDRQCAVNLVNDSNWPSFESHSHQIKLVKLLVDSVKDVKTLNLAAKGFRWLYSTYVNKDLEELKLVMSSCFDGLCSAIERVSETQQCGNVCIFLFKNYSTCNLFELRPKILRLFFNSGYDSWKQKASDKIKILIEMIKYNVYPKLPEWHLNIPCTITNRKAVIVWTCMSRKEIHVLLLCFLENTFEQVKDRFAAARHTDKNDFEVQILIQTPPPHLHSAFQFDKGNWKPGRIIQEVVDEDLQPSLVVRQLEGPIITLQKESVEKYLRTMYNQRVCVAPHERRERQTIVRNRPSPHHSPGRRIVKVPYQTYQSPGHRTAKFPKLMINTNRRPGILGSPPKELKPLACLNMATGLPRIFQTGQPKVPLVGVTRPTGIIAPAMAAHGRGTLSPAARGGIVGPLIAATPVNGPNQRLRGAPLGRGGWSGIGLPNRGMPRGFPPPRGMHRGRGMINPRMMRGGVNHRILRGTRGARMPRGRSGTRSGNFTRMASRGEQWIGGS